MENKIQFKVGGIKCGNCATKIKDGLGQLDQHLEVEVMVEAGTVQVESDEKLSTMGLKKEIEGLGFAVESFSKG